MTVETKWLLLDLLISEIYWTGFKVSIIHCLYPEFESSSNSKYDDIIDDDR